MIIRSNNGPQFISHIFEKKCMLLNVEHEKIPTKCPNKNAHIESFNRILEDECLSKYEFESFSQAYYEVCENMDYYNNVRMHSAIEYLSPREYHEAFINNKIKPVVVRI